MAIFVDGEQEVALRGEAQSGNVFTMSEWERIRFVAAKCQYLKDADLIHVVVNSLDKVENSHTIADGRKQTSTIRTEKEISLAVDGAKQVLKPEFRLHLGLCPGAV